ncbi:Insertion element IS630 uncharacterized 39 kDa protein [Labeo rohita]|uniref:Insertion element IS630 uncharacterized 39 kDa protein n=1 Tax=Labeo rohita TaxID=84645 RepID=A0ABQ8L3X6_LABRO|nr:Insertion element IS630 uncharacterized 39 kDa protein [Labeo rohita]
MEAGRARGRGRGRGRQRERGGRGRRGHARTIISDDIRAALVDHVINHGLTMREAGQRVHPNLSRFTVSSIIRTFRLENRAIVHVPGQHGGNITLCAAISLRGLLHHHSKLGPYNVQHIITFLDALHDAVVQDRPEQPRFVVVWDNVSFHRAAIVRNWFTNHDQFEVVYLPPYSPFLNPIEEFFSAWMPLLQAMEQACGDIEVRSIHGWIRHTRGYFPRYLAREDIACDVDEILWPDPKRRQDP